MLLDRNDQELAAMRRLSASTDFSIFVGWMRRCLDAKRDELVICGGDENTRWLLEARYILDYSDGELARELGVKPDSVRMALTRARRKARRLMESQHNEQNV